MASLFLTRWIFFSWPRVSRESAMESANKSPLKLKEDNFIEKKAGAAGPQVHPMGGYWHEEAEGILCK